MVLFWQFLFQKVIATIEDFNVQQLFHGRLIHYKHFKNLFSKSIHRKTKPFILLIDDKSFIWMVHSPIQHFLPLYLTTASTGHASAIEFQLGQIILATITVPSNATKDGIITKLDGASCGYRCHHYFSRHYFSSNNILYCFCCSSGCC
jgi:hypothetical protein